jgi:lipopolysaccharide transport system ATP-binding protein
LTGRENVYLNGAILGMTRAEIARKFDEIVAFAEIDKFIDTPVKHFSSGMYVRLAFAVAAHLEPEILLVDEVLAVGDIAFQRKCLGKMNAVATTGRTVLFVSHNLTAINTLCNSAVLLDIGRIAAIGNTAEVVQQYLAAGAEATARVHFEHLAGKVAQITGLAVLDGAGNAAAQFDVTSPIVVRVDYRTDLPLHNHRITVTVSREDGLEIIHTATTDAGEVIGELPPGRHAACLTLPSQFLAPASYRVSAELREPRGKHDQREYALGFTISGSPHPGAPNRGRGLLIYPFEWNLSAEGGR